MKDSFRYSVASHRQVGTPERIKKIGKSCKLTHCDVIYSGYYFSGEVRYVIVVEGSEEDVKLFKKTLENL
jgi:hypothetical protein